MLPPLRFARYGPLVAVLVTAVGLLGILGGAFGIGVSGGLRLVALGVGVLAHLRRRRDGGAAAGQAAHARGRPGCDLVGGGR